MSESLSRKEILSRLRSHVAALEELERNPRAVIQLQNPNGTWYTYDPGEYPEPVIPQCQIKTGSIYRPFVWGKDENLESNLGKKLIFKSNNHFAIITGVDEIGIVTGNKEHTWESAFEEFDFYISRFPFGALNKD